MSDERFTVSVHRRARSPFWQARIYLAGEGGRERRWSTEVPVGDTAAARRQSQRQAERVAADHASKLVNAIQYQAAEQSDASLSKVGQRMLDTKYANNARPRWLDSLAFQLDHLVVPHFGAGRDVRTIRRADLEAFKASLRERGMASSSINNALTAIRQVLHHAWKVDELLEGKVECPNVERDRTPKWHLLKPAEIAKWATSTKAGFKPEPRDEKDTRPRQKTTASEAQEAQHLLLFIANTGVRRTEALSIRFSWVDWPKHLILVPAEATKGGRRREPIACNVVVMRVLAERRVLHAKRRDQQDDRVFRNNRRMTREATRSAERAGLGQVRLHDLRHTLGSLHVASGATLTEVRDTLGHSTMDMVSHYQHAYLERRHETASRVVLDVDQAPTPPPSPAEVDLTAAAAASGADIGPSGRRKPRS